jgi:hypothetical protein
MPYYCLYRELALLLILLGPIQELNIDFIIRFPTTIRDSGEVDTILIIINYYIKISFFTTVSTIINTAKLAEIFYRKIKYK